MKLLNVCAAVAACVVMTGCVTPAKYSWGNYENSLYRYYKDPASAGELAIELEKTISAAERTKQPLGPGIYAEYGYLLLQHGKSKEAIPYFQKEKTAWKESTYLMDSMIRIAESGSKKAVVQK